MLQIGDQFDHFRITAHIAQGAMADIYGAVDLASGRQVALKIPNHLMLGDPAQSERFNREMEITKTLEHPSIQKGIATGQYDRTPYIATELIEGTSLREIINTRAPLPTNEALSIIRKIADGVQFCHDNQVIHRDLKPENILIKSDGQPVIIDFGLALTKGSRRVTYANISTTAGTPDYMAPEQIEGQRGDERTDQYAIGTMLYELLSGKTPFTGDNHLAIMAQHLNGVIPRLDREVPGISPQIAAVVAKSLQRDPSDRYPSLTAFIDALDHLDQVDTSILDKLPAPAAVKPFWQTQAFQVAMAAVLIVVVIVLIGIVGQGVAR